MDLWTSPTDRREPCGPCGQPVDNADALPTALPTLSRLSPTSSTGPTTGDSHTTTPHNPSPRLPPPTVQDNICLPLKPIPTSPTAWLTPNPSGSFPYGIRLGGEGLLGTAQKKRHLSQRRTETVLRVARTIADLARTQGVGAEHIAEAVGYQRVDLDASCVER